MDTDSGGDDAAALRARVKQLEQTVSEQQQTIESLSQPTASRRAVLGGAAAAAGLGALGWYSSYPARADAAGQVGTDSSPVDLKANRIGFPNLANDYEVQKDGTDGSNVINFKTQ